MTEKGPTGFRLSGFHARKVCGFRIRNLLKLNGNFCMRMFNKRERLFWRKVFLGSGGKKLPVSFRIQMKKPPAGVGRGTQNRRAFGSDQKWA